MSDKKHAKLGITTSLEKQYQIPSVRLDALVIPRPLPLILLKGVF